MSTSICSPPNADRGSRRNFMKAAAAASATAAVLPARAADRGRTDKVRLAVVGGGFGATFWWHEHPNCQVTAVTDLREDRRHRLMARYSCKNVFDSLEIMLDKAAADFDAVAVFSGAPRHVDHVVMCMEAPRRPPWAHWVVWFWHSSTVP